MKIAQVFHIVVSVYVYNATNEFIASMSIDKATYGAALTTNNIFRTALFRLFMI